MKMFSLHFSDYLITKEELSMLIERINEMKVLVERICKEKIASVEVKI